MSDLTESGRQVIADIAARYGLSQDAVEQMARAVSNGGGTMAQFNIPELGGGGQWMAGGMTMVGDMFNHGLKATVDGLCAELSNGMANAPFFKRPQTIAGAAWWPADLGQPSSVGGQNQFRYAYFPQACRVALDPGNGTPVVLLDTLDHQIGGFSQQQSGYGDPFGGVSFSSQYGQFALSSLPRIGAPAPQPEPVPQPEPIPQQVQPDFQQPEPMPTVAEAPAPSAQPAQAPTDIAEILGTIEKLAALRDAGALTEEEFSAKKVELLARL
ncbi:SHOCT domain-containing protein [Tropicimonas sp. TH_r6]|uniref:SHOCT domain-containing protein n=1 Tax=Tropicimonas sp. TH_r6 TaxID=3082085 RepID=UPI00295450CB|nr:SHOCT domain-containing protein [Tropicimonas sp. TH_r6]MDV7145732.1 SHOCT domain-containing protein [Tropicimonas sp. TH_r6]